MKYTTRKFFVDYEKEEKWLNEMSSLGMALTDYSWCRYVFEKAPEGKYLYRIELLEEPPGHPKSAAYISFLENNGIEAVAVYNRWIYMRKLASDGPFDIYTDIDSKIKHVTRIAYIYNSVCAVELGAAVLNLIVGFVALSGIADIGRSGELNICIGVSTLLLSAIFFAFGYPARKKLKKLRMEKLLHE